ncbi:hypothetical protein DF3PB_600011 [uncultured Defluviicoccus sp.]|uniref:Uncharacterized protein n=1 Tax=metagenome TaxID=256318 RepID=A0A380TJP1_9ZZZZ|nr:hypothetical protein DF3PB_600011 [uncultured Defluviicoccus sp.]
MKYRAALSQLRNDLAAIKAAAPTARVEMYDADDEDPYADVISGSGSGVIDHIRICREMGMEQWIDFVRREVRA